MDQTIVERRVSEHGRALGVNPPNLDFCKLEKTSLIELGIDLLCRQQYRLHIRARNCDQYSRICDLIFSLCD